jgi:hypothetical protein
MVAYLLSLIATCCFFAQPGTASGELYVKHRTGAMQTGATSAEVRQLTDLLSDDAVYEHPAVGIRIAGREAIRKAIEAQLGATRNARSNLLGQISQAGVSVISEQLTFEARDGETWRTVTRLQLLLFEYKDGKVSRILEYWER